MDPRLRQLQDSISSCIRDMSPEQLAWALPEKWNAAQVLEHLLLTYTGTVKGCERCLEVGKPLAKSPPTLRQRVRITAIVGLGYMPEGRPAPERSRPKGLPAEKVLAEIGPKIAAMDELLTQCENRYGRVTCLMDHPVLGPLTAQQWRKFHWVHGRHHVRQIRAMRAHMEQEK